MSIGMKWSGAMAPRLASRIRRSTCALCLAVIAASAAGQSAPPADNQGGQRRQRQNAQAAQPAQAVSLSDLYRGVACQAAADPASLEAMLATAPFSAGERDEAGRVLRLVQRCQRGAGGTSTSSVLLRAVIAETMLESRFPSPQAARTPAVGVAPLLNLAAATTRANAATLAPAYALAQCTAERRGDAVRAFLASDPGTPAEQAAFGVLNPALAACISGSAALNVDLRTLRGVLAESLYRWSVVQRDGAAAPFAAAP